MNYIIHDKFCQNFVKASRYRPSKFWQVLYCTNVNLHNLIWTYSTLSIKGTHWVTRGCPALSHASIRTRVKRNNYFHSKLKYFYWKNMNFILVHLASTRWNVISFFFFLRLLCVNVHRLLIRNEFTFNASAVCFGPFQKYFLQLFCQAVPLIVGSNYRKTILSWNYATSAHHHDFRPGYHHSPFRTCCSKRLHIIVYVLYRMYLKGRCGLRPRSGTTSQTTLTSRDEAPIIEIHRDSNYCTVYMSCRSSGARQFKRRVFFFCGSEGMLMTLDADVRDIGPLPMFTGYEPYTIM